MGKMGEQDQFKGRTMKISFTDYIEWYRKMSMDKPSPQRVGQWFCNSFNITDSSLFYETNNGQAMNKIMEYVDTLSLTSQQA